MKRYMPWLVAGLAVAWLVSTLIPPAEKEFQSREFGRLPVLLNGRVQPLDSVARNALLQLRAKQSVHVTDNATGKTILSLSAIDWLKEVLFRPELADTRPTFRVDHPEVIALLKIRREDKHFSFAEIQPALGDLEKEARRIGDSNLKAEQQTPFEKAVMGLYNRLILYRRLKNSLKPESVTEMVQFQDAYQKAIEPGRAAVEAQRQGKPFDQAAMDALVGKLTDFDMVSRFAYPLMIPVATAEHAKEDWENAGTAMMEAARRGTLPEPMTYYATMNDAFRAGDAAKFNQTVAGYHQWLQGHGYQKEVTKGQNEHFYNRLQAFYRSMVLYVGALLCAFISWINRNETLRRTAVGLTLVALVLHTGGLIFRMALEGRPPVTNLYSSAIFIGWGTVILGLVLERFYRDGIGTVVAGVTGFCTLVVAHNLATSGDTMEMLRAVLDTNFWLATHVVVITLGYSATFVAGFLAVLYVLRGFLTTTLTADGARTLSRMVYGITCFAILCSFVGTVLGGIWADQSWGRFWGWDPKENGALLIVIWNAFYLHARWGKIFSEKALMATAVFGNVITAFSWFGVNMLGIGLHSYGFMDAAFKWLILFDVTQLVIIAMALLPLRHWRSFKEISSATGDKGAKRPAALVPKVKPA
ncbi:MAG: cytochrome c biogenesis protein CcsA [Verrucomicrobiales bacterium]|nr:cytochrome c biogenesis protein CcsA [Verrucomicrobiales bacterium]